MLIRYHFSNSAQDNRPWSLVRVVRVEVLRIWRHCWRAPGTAPPSPWCTAARKRRWVWSPRVCSAISRRWAYHVCSERRGSPGRRCCTRTPRGACCASWGFERPASWRSRCRSRKRRRVSEARPRQTRPSVSSAHGSARPQGPSRPAGSSPPAAPRSRKRKSRREMKYNATSRRDVSRCN